MASGAARSESIREHFDGQARDYYDYAAEPTNAPHRVKQARLQTAIEWGTWPRHESVLSVGCGVAPLLHVLQSTHPHLDLSGCDLSPRMVEVATESVPGADVAQADAADLPYADGQFDAVVSLGLLPYVADPETVIAELARVAAGGGQVICNWSNDGLAKRIRLGYQALRRAGKRLTGLGSITPYRLRTQSRADVLEWARSAGLVIERVRYLNCAPGLTRTPLERDLGKLPEGRLEPLTARLATVGIFAATKGGGA